MDELPEELTLENSVNTLQELAQKGYVAMPETIYQKTRFMITKAILDGFVHLRLEVMQ